MQRIHFTAPALLDLLLDVSQLLLQLLHVPEAGVPPAVVEHQGGLAGSGLSAGGQLTPSGPETRIMVTNGFVPKEGHFFETTSPRPVLRQLTESLS